MNLQEIFNTDLTLNEKVELASALAMTHVNKVIQRHIDNYNYWENRDKIASVKYEDTDLYRLEQKAKLKRQCKCNCHKS